MHIEISVLLHTLGTWGSSDTPPRKLECLRRLVCSSLMSGQSELDPLGRVAYFGRALGCLLLGVAWRAMAWIIFSSSLWAQPHTFSHFMLFRQTHKVGCRSASRGLGWGRKAARVPGWHEQVVSGKRGVEDHGEHPKTMPDLPTTFISTQILFLSQF